MEKVKIFGGIAIAAVEEEFNQWSEENKNILILKRKVSLIPFEHRDGKTIFFTITIFYKE